MLIKTIIKIYFLLIVLWFGMYLLEHIQWWPFVLLDYIGYFFFWPAIPILLVALFLKNIRYAGMAIVPILIFTFFFHPFLPPRTIQNYEKAHLRVLTYNIWNQNREIDRIASVIEQIDADLIGIQELKQAIRSELIDRLSNKYPYYYVSTPTRGGTTALFSKSLLTSITELDFGVDRPAIIGETTVNGRDITIISAHFNAIYYAFHNRPIRDIPRAIEQYIVDQNKQAKLLIDFLQKHGSSAIVLACDCNSHATASTHRILQTFFTDAAAHIGWALGSTPVKNAIYERDLNRVDYIWYSGALTPAGVYRMIDSGGSDHLPVFGDFNWQSLAYE